MKIFAVILLSTTFLVGGTVHGAVATFEGLSLPNERLYAGPGGGRYWSGLVPPTDGSINSAFVSGGMSFGNRNTNSFGFTFWEGFAYSDTKDTVTAGAGNQYSAFAGSGAAGSATYGIGFGPAARIEFPAPTRVAGAEFTNTTYAVLAIRDGDDGFGAVKQFGGPGGDDEDFFKLVIIGEDGNGDPTGAVSFLLADYTFDNNALDYFVADWVFVDLSPLGSVSALSFDFQSTDVGPFGINTPTYFAIDNLTTVPLPAPVALLGSAFIGLIVMRRRAGMP